MPNRAFSFGEATVTITPSGAAAQTIAFATGMSKDTTPVILEDGSAAFRRVRLTVDSVWVDDDLKSVTEAAGPHKVYISWTNEDDARLRSDGLESAALTGYQLRGALDGGVQTWSLSFEGLSRN